ncbi:hypothetical protein [Burkholderia cenocepacia]|uniref:hypothetical protein n=1 Tax=Burkholderia cenocepacia TaxID=95486 RepID=UPI0011BE748E|nr:hypothetical protein [Burkholderia cenocepacia]
MDMNIENILIAKLDELLGDWQWERVLSIFREHLIETISSISNMDEGGIYLMIYDCGVIRELFGSNSAIYVGMKKGADDAIRIASVELSITLVDKLEELGRRHGVSIRSVMSSDILFRDGAGIAKL